MNCQQQRSTKQLQKQQQQQPAIFPSGKKKHIESAGAGTSVSSAAEHTFLAGTSYPLELSQTSGTSNRDHLHQRSSLPLCTSNQAFKPENDVEIVAGPESEGVRPDLDEQATECSSSFGYTDVDGYSDDGTEVQSTSRNEDAAASGDGTPVRKKRALNMDWKNYRKGIEWRSRWLDLRLTLLKQQAAKYDRVSPGVHRAQKLQASMQQPAGCGVSRACPLPEEQPAPVLHRLRRRKVENTADVEAYMSKHPLFSRYEKKRKKRDFDPDGNHLFEASALAECARSRQDELDIASMAEPDSVQQVVWKAESLQTRLMRLKGLLKASMTPQQGRAGRVGRGRSGRPLSSATPMDRDRTSKGIRRRASDFDINNVVMPVSVGTKYVEHIKHANIETPQWRHLTTKNASVLVDPRGSSSSISEENTDDETYKARHGPLEIRERRNRYVPRNNKKTSEGDVQCSSSKAYGGPQ